MTARRLKQSLRSCQNLCTRAEVLAVLTILSLYFGAASDWSEALADSTNPPAKAQDGRSTSDRSVSGADSSSRSEADGSGKSAAGAAGDPGDSSADPKASSATRDSQRIPPAAGVSQGRAAATSKVESQESGKGRTPAAPAS